MHTKALLVGVLAAAVVSAEAQGPENDIVRRDDSTTTTTKTKKDHTKMHDPPSFQTVDPAKVYSLLLGLPTI